MNSKHPNKPNKTLSRHQGPNWRYAWADAILLQRLTVHDETCPRPGQMGNLHSSTQYHHFYDLQDAL